MSRIPNLVPSSSRSEWITLARASSETILASEVIQKVVAARAGEPVHDARAVSWHRVERYHVETRPWTEQELYQLARVDPAGAQTAVPQVKYGLFLEAEQGQRLAEAGHAYGKRVRKGLRSSTRNPEPRNPSHRCYPFLPTTPTQDGYDRESNPHY